MARLPMAARMALAPYSKSMPLDRSSVFIPSLEAMTAATHMLLWCKGPTAIFMARRSAVARMTLAQYSKLTPMDRSPLFIPLPSAMTERFPTLLWRWPAMAISMAPLPLLAQMTAAQYSRSMPADHSPLFIHLLEAISSVTECTKRSEWI